MYGLDANSLPPPWSLFASILLVFGISSLGFIFKKIFYKKSFNLKEQLFKFFFINLVIGTSLIGPILYPLLLFGSSARFHLFIFGVTLISFGFIFIIYLIKYAIFSFNVSCPAINGNLDIKKISYKFLFFLLVLGYGFISMSPPTDADEADYHLGVPISILNEGSWIFSPEWFTSRLAGLGECYIALGLAIGAEQFGSILQTCGLFAVLSLLTSPIIFSNKKKLNFF